MRSVALSIFFHEHLKKVGNGSGFTFAGSDERRTDQVGGGIDGVTQCIVGAVNERFAGFASTDQHATDEMASMPNGALERSAQGFAVGQQVMLLRVKWLWQSREGWVRAKRCIAAAAALVRQGQWQGMRGAASILVQGKRKREQESHEIGAAHFLFSSFFVVCGNVFGVAAKRKSRVCAEEGVNQSAKE